VIVSFADRATADIYNGLNTRDARRIPSDLWRVVRRKLDMLNAAHRLRDLEAPPGNCLEALKGDLRGLYGIRVNKQFRIVFRFEDGQASHVRCRDYH